MKKVIKWAGLCAVGMIGYSGVMAVTGDTDDVYEPAPISTPTHTQTPTSFNTATPVATFVPTDEPVPPTETPISPTNTPVPPTDTPTQSIQEHVKDAQYYKNKCGVGARGWITISLAKKCGEVMPVCRSDNPGLYEAMYDKNEDGCVGE